MFTQKKSLFWLAAFAILALAIAACQPEVQTVEVTRVVETTVVETVTVEGQEVEVTRVVTETIVETVVETVTVEVPAPGEETAPADFTAADNTTYRTQTFGDIDTMDPNLAYDTASGGLIMNTMEPLIFFNHEDANTFVPVLAKEVPSVDNGLISEDGLTYTFNIREGVTFHEGGTLEPHDVAYTFQRDRKSVV